MASSAGSSSHAYIYCNTFSEEIGNIYIPVLNFFSVKKLVIYNCIKFYCLHVVCHNLFSVIISLEECAIINIILYL